MVRITYGVINRIPLSMVDIKEEFFDTNTSIKGEYESSISDNPVFTEELSPARKRARTSTSVRCPCCNAWNKSDAEKCYNSFCNHNFNGKVQVQSQDVSYNGSDSKCSVSLHRIRKMHEIICTNCGASNSIQSVLCRNAKCRSHIRKTRRRITKVSKDPETDKESPTKVPQSAHSKHLQRRLLCDNPINNSKCVCSNSGTTTGKEGKTQGELREKPAAQRKSMRNLAKDQPHVTTDWTEEEKKLLLSAIEKYGVIDVEKLRSAVVTKSKENIWAHILQSSKIARGHLLRSAASQPSYRAPIDEWLGIMESAQPPTYHENRALPIARSILYIAKYEPQPKPEDCGGIDFKSMYEVLYALLSGLPPKKLTGPTAKYFAKSFEKMIQTSNSYRLNERVDFLKTVKSVSYMPTKSCKKYSGKKTSAGSDSTDFIMDLQGMNPLRVYSNLYHLK